MVAVENPGFLAAAALGGIDHQRTLAKGDAGKSAGNDNRLFPVKDEWPQIDVTSGESFPFAMRRMT